MSLPLAYFLTWTCYGQRLPGDPRGSVDRQHNRRGTPYLAPDLRRHEAALKRMTGPKVSLTPPMREVADRAIIQLCADRSWHLITQNVRETHAHTIVNCRGAVSPERAMTDLKARITRDLRESALAAPDATIWTDHGSTRWLNHEPGLYAAIAYVNDWQSGPNREILEERKREIRDRIRALREWLNSQGLPEDGHTVVMNETPEERQSRLSPESLLSPKPSLPPKPFHNEPGTQ